MIFSYNTTNSAPLLDGIETVKDIDSRVTEGDLEKAGVVEEINSVEDFQEILNGDEPIVFAKFTEDISLGASQNLTIPAGKELHLELDNTIQCSITGFKVEDGGKLFLSGEGTIITSNKSTAGAMIEVGGPNSKVVIDGPTFDAITVNGKTTSNCNHAIYLKEGATIEFKSGLVKTAYGSCITANNTTGNAIINISGGELYSDGSYALYIPSECTVNISNNAVVQGINARMGKFNITDNVEIIPTTITSADYDDIGLNINTSGCIWFGDTIAVVAGTYTDVDGTDCVFNIGNNVTVAANFRSAIGIYEVDTKEAQNVTFNIANRNNISTTAEGFEAISVYDHEYITAAAEAAGKTFNPVAQSNVVINVA